MSSPIYHQPASCLSHAQHPRATNGHLRCVNEHETSPLFCDDEKTQDNTRTKHSELERKADRLSAHTTCKDSDEAQGYLCTAWVQRGPVEEQEQQPPVHSAPSRQTVHTSHKVNPKCTSVHGTLVHLSHLKRTSSVGELQPSRLGRPHSPTDLTHNGYVQTSQKQGTRH